MDLIFNPLKLTGVVGIVLFAVPVCIILSGVLMCWVIINQLPWGHEQAFAWFVGEVEYPDGVDQTWKADLAPAELNARGATLAEVLGGRQTQGYHPGHPGRDIGGIPAGTGLPALLGGEVTRAGWSDVGYGNLVEYRGGDWTVMCAHLQDVYVKPGDQVDQGTLLGTVGSTGNSSGAHVHVEVWYKGARVDPNLLAASIEAEEDEAVLPDVGEVLKD